MIPSLANESASGFGQRDLPILVVQTKPVIIALAHPANAMDSSDRLFVCTRNLRLAGYTAETRRVSGIVAASIGEAMEFSAGLAYAVWSASIPFAVGGFGHGPYGGVATLDTVGRNGGTRR